ncbi:MAG: hypothetical protein P8144_11960 [Gammaproteobacteria bacterium]
MKDAIKAQLLQLNTSLAETNSITALQLGGGKDAGAWRTFYLSLICF